MTYADAVRSLVEEVRRRASESEVFDYGVESVNSDQLRTTGLEEVARALEDTRGAVEDEEPDPATIGLLLTSPRFGRRSILVAPIDGNSFTIGLGRKALVATARFRANLETDEDRSDLYLFLVCPPGDPGGPHRRRVLERNEALARTHVWVPSTREANWPGEARRFLDRTFLAPPTPTGTGPSGDLTPLQTELDRLVSQKVIDGMQASRWAAILAGPADEDRDIGAELLAVMDGGRR